MVGPYKRQKGESHNMKDKLLQLLIDYKTPLDRHEKKMGEYLEALYERYLQDLDEA